MTDTRKIYKLKGTLKPIDYQPATNQKDAEHLIKSIGDNRREVLRIEAKMNDKIAEIKQAHEIEAQPFNLAISNMLEEVQTWAEANRSLLTDDGKTKTVRVATGEISWRARPPKVTLRGKDKIIEALKRLGLQRFIRTAEDINKEALLAEPKVAQTIMGVSIGSAGEDFNIEPYEQEIDGSK